MIPSPKWTFVVFTSRQTVFGRERILYARGNVGGAMVETRGVHAASEVLIFAFLNIGSATICGQDDDVVLNIELVTRKMIKQRLEVLAGERGMRALLYCKRKKKKKKKEVSLRH